mmetsp:Transcript_21978/g.54292  ORF Transcript_21978/g.54292 Transcript_21978/m.54292 type:complete len:232 (-) Transcript_21978:851-1546(-)
MRQELEGLGMIRLQVSRNGIYFTIRKALVGNLGIQETQAGPFKAFGTLDLDLLITVHESIRFIDNGISQNLFNNIFECNDSSDFIDWVFGLILIVDISDEGKMGFSLFQFGQNITKVVIGPDHVHTTTKDLNKTSNGDFIFWINENQILDKEQTNDIVPRDFIDRNSRVASLEDFGNVFKTELVIYIEHKGTLQRCHDVFNAHILVRQGTLHGSRRLLVKDIFLDVNLQKL